MSRHLTHPESDQEIEVENDQVSLYLSAGWELKPGVKPPADS